MNVFKNTKTFKKLIISIVIITMLMVGYSRPVHAWLEMEDVLIAPAKIFYLLEEGVLTFLDAIFCDSRYNGNGITEISPETIIKGRFLLMNANIFEEVEANSDEYYDAGTSGVVNGRRDLRNVISGWYYALRNFAIIALLSILVYIGIRMVISTIAQDKAKYKSMFKDWFIALCLLFAMHYIMVGALNISSLITNAIGNSGQIANITDKCRYIISNTTGGDADWDHYTWTDEEGLAGEPGKEYDMGDAYAQVIVLGAIIVFTVMFIFKYLKRMMTIIFLILLGPISCITYPIDKISDGKSQAYNKWLKEFFIQVIIQPFHLMIYVVLLGSASTLANTNVLYAIMCFAIMIPAEKFVKEMFGVKEQLGSPLGAMATGALAGKALSALTKGMKGSATGGKNGEGDNDSTQRGLPTKTISDKSDLVDGNGGATTGIGDGSNRDDNSNVERNENNPTDNQGLENNESATGQLDSENQIGIQESGDNDINTNNQVDDNEQQGLSDESGDEQQRLKNRVLNSGPATFAKEKIEAGKGKASALRAIHNQRMSKKWGSTNKKQRWKNRAKRTAKSFAKGVAIGTLGAAAATIALANGEGKEALGILAGVGAYAGSKGVRAIKGATGAVKDYHRGLMSDGKREQKALNDFKADKKQQDLAVLNYRKNHDGKDPGYEELEQEMEDRFALSRYGLSDGEIDDVLPVYQDKKNELVKSGMDKARAEQIAAGQAKQTSKYAKYYKPKDFQSSKTMSEAYNNLFNDLKAETNCSDEIADKYARQYLTNAAKMHGLSQGAIALPPRNETIDIPISQKVPSSLGIENSNITNEQTERLNNITLRFQNMGYDDKSIAELAASLKDSRVTPEAVIEKFAVNVEYLEDKNVQAQASQILSATTNKNKFTDVEIRTEVLKMNELRNMGVNEQSIGKVRRQESKLKSEKSVEVARNMAINKNIDKEAIQKQLEADLKQEGFSQKAIEQELEKTMKLYKDYNIKQ